MFYRTGKIITDSGVFAISLDKEFYLNKNTVSCRTRIKNHSDKSLKIRFGEEFNLSNIDKDNRGIENNIAELSIDGREVNVSFYLSEEFDVWHSEIKTVSKNHHEFEEIKQADCYVFLKRFEILPEKQTEFSIEMRIST
jgi:hypothetical protein